MTRLFWISIIVAFGLGLTGYLTILSAPERTGANTLAGSNQKQALSDVGGAFSRYFAPNYPVHDKFKSELDLLRKKGRLKIEDEKLIDDSVEITAQRTGIPPAILWCLFFQESRLNHLEGIQGDTGARGLGQFSHFSFYEINHHLDRYDSRNSRAMEEILGRDMRPIRPSTKDLRSPSSYFFIPTAVVTSAAFLNNRYHQLRRTLEKRKLMYHPDLLWMYAAMAYNKGGRSVLTFLNDARRRGGKRLQEKLLLDTTALVDSTSDAKLLARSLKKIWPEHAANLYAREWSIHTLNMRACAMNRSPGGAP